MSSRDPRVDPQPWDVLRQDGGEKREVVAVNPATFLKNGQPYEATVTFIFSRGISICPLESWRKWAKSAEVVRVSGEDR